MCGWLGWFVWRDGRVVLVSRGRRIKITYIANHTVLQRLVGWLVEFCAACYAY
jgi:hypothetical protein